MLEPADRPNPPESPQKARGLPRSCIFCSKSDCKPSGTSIFFAARFIKVLGSRVCLLSNPIAMASTLRALASTLRAMASNQQVLASPFGVLEWADSDEPNQR